MIVTALITFAFYLASLILLFLPESSGFPSDVENGITTIGSYVGIFDPLLPIPTIASIITLVIAFELSIFAFKTLKWLVSYIPFVGGRG